LVKECEFFLSLAVSKKVKIPNELKAAAEVARKRFLDKGKRKSEQDKAGHSGKRARSSISKDGDESDVYMAALNKEDDSIYDFWNGFEEEEEYSLKCAVENFGFKRAKIAKQHTENREIKLPEMVCDSGASVNICNDRNGLVNLRPIRGVDPRVSIADGSYMIATEIGDLIQKFGNEERIIKGTYVVPEAEESLFSVGQYYNQYKDRAGIVTCRGVYDIKLSDPRVIEILNDGIKFATFRNGTYIMIMNRTLKQGLPR
jgi:hypothetical protein